MLAGLSFGLVITVTAGFGIDVICFSDLFESSLTDRPWHEPIRLKPSMKLYKVQRRRMSLDS